MIPAAKKWIIDHILRPAFEYVGLERYSNPALGDLGEKLLPYLDFEDGVFVELGANDGFEQSNTYYLEKFRGWSGVLVEPIPRLYQQAIKNRPRSRVFNFACVSPDFEEKAIKLIDANLMSIVKGSLPQHATERAYQELQRGVQVDLPQVNFELREVEVPTRTLTSILDECNVQHIDFLSLDVEGYEFQVLRGLDLERYRPTYILVEVFDRDGVNTRPAIESLLLKYYVIVDQLTFHDVLYRRKSPS